MIKDLMKEMVDIQNGLLPVWCSKCHRKFQQVGALDAAGRLPKHYTRVNRRICIGYATSVDPGNT